VPAAGPTTPAYEVEDVATAWSEQLLGWGPDFHDLLLGDELRMRAYRLAIGEVIRPGDVVVDVGTGTGVLARWALHAGAARAYGIERDAALLDRAVAAAAAVGLADRFVPVAGLSFDVALPERADVLVSEILGNLVDNEGSTAILADARRRFLRPGGRTMPARAERYLVPVEARRAHRQVAAQGGPGDTPFDAYYDVVLPRSGYLATPRVDRVFTVDDDTTSYRSELVFPVHRAGVLTGFKGWFVADLSPTVALDIGGDDPAGGRPGRTTSDSWRHAYLPVARPIRVDRHDRVALTLERRDGDRATFAQSYAWHGAVWRDDDAVARFAHRT
jgi:protein arginine N-methyltransferase 1